MIEDISRDHPDHMRIVIALNANSAGLRRLWFRPETAHRYQPEHFLQSLRPGL
jgi:hypothetical protein